MNEAGLIAYDNYWNTLRKTVLPSVPDIPRSLRQCGISFEAPSHEAVQAMARRIIQALSVHRSPPETSMFRWAHGRELRDTALPLPSEVAAMRDGLRIF